MLTGLPYLFAQVALLAVGAAILGLLGGRYLWAGRQRERVSDPGRPGAAIASDTSPAAPADLEPALSGLEQRLRASESEVEDLRQAMSQIADRKDTEMGRLESGAIRALDTVILTHQEQIAALEARLEATELAATEQAELLAAERVLGQRLRAALDSRDSRIAALSRQLNGS